MPTRRRGSKPKGVSKAHSKSVSKSATVGLKVDADLKRRWLEVAGVVEDAKRRGMSAFDELWEAVGEIANHDPPLYLAAGCATFKAFLEQYIGDDERTAKRNMRVARFASPHEEERYGVSKIDAALSYLEAKTGAELKGRLPVAFDRLKIPTAARGARKDVPFEEATVQELATATRKLRSSSSAPGNAKESPVVKAVRSALAVDGLRAISIRYSGGKLALAGIEPAIVAKLGKALARTRLPDDPRADRRPSR
jgi:hypothetical protein